MQRPLHWLFAPLLLLLLSACAPAVQTNYLSSESAAGEVISQETVALNTSTPRLDVVEAFVITDNDDAFESKVAMIKQAGHSIDLAYYIYEDDYSSSVISQALIDAAQRGVRVRMLLDYFTNYTRLDYLSMLEHYASQGSGSLEVRFYGRPTRNIIKDAVFLTMGCGEVMEKPELRGCGEAKYAEIDRIFEQETTDSSLPYDYQNISNFSSGGSGIFLSGLYGKNLEVALTAIMEGQNIDRSRFKKKKGANEPADTKAKIEGKQMDMAFKAAKVFWQAREGNPKRFERLLAHMTIQMAFALYGEQLHPLYDAMSAYLPVERRRRSAEVLRDWDYITEFLHHKLLLVDQRLFQLGGRNVEDSYHMQPSHLVHKYLFMDTDVRVNLQSGEATLTEAFERIWNFTPMVATMAEVREHAPNDYLVAHNTATLHCAELHPTKGTPEHEACYTRAFGAVGDLDARIPRQHETMLNQVETFHTEYVPSIATARTPQFVIDPGAEIYYIENLPFERPQPDTLPVRSYGARNGLEGESGKYIHNLWLTSLRHTCHLASAEQPQRVIFHNAYLFMPSNMLRAIGAMFDGRMDCRHVHLTVVTNSPETTDLNVINLAARYAAKGLAEYYLDHRDPERAATFSYYEYASLSQEAGEANRSLHSKVMVFGPDIFLGSANTDVRSYMMDSNNGLYVQAAPNLVSSYSAWVDKLVADTQRVHNKTGYIQKMTLEEMLASDTAFITAMLKRLTGPSLEERVSLEDLAERIARILKAIHDLTAEMLQEDEPDEEAQRNFNALFKVL